MFNAYDGRGNLIEKNVYNFTEDESITSSPIETTTFTYANDGWTDQLIAVNDTELTYDEIGNVLTYGDKSFTWSNGRNLARITDGDNTYSYTYDENGIRTSKTVNGVTTYYNTKDGVILSQTDGTNTMYFQYDTNGIPLGFVRNGTQYLYLTNQMGDVVAITDADGIALAEYGYDEWGKLAYICYVADDLPDEQLESINANPILYRGYYYDFETGYYYLQSRYYDPTICRFINADAPEYAEQQKDDYVGTNLFAYCGNDPINKYDPSGHFIFVILIVATIVSSVSVKNILSEYNNKNYFKSLKLSKSGYGEKGKIEINLVNNKRFCDDIYEAMKISSKQTFSLLAQYAASLFKKEYKRNFLFNNESLAYEIEFHVRGWLVSRNYSDIDLTDDMQDDIGHVSGMLFAEYLKNHCKIVDIAENDAYDSKQRKVFGYYNAVRTEYLKTKKDPYYNSKKKSRSSSYTSNDWKKLSF